MINFKLSVFVGANHSSLLIPCGPRASTPIKDTADKSLDYLNMHSFKMLQKEDLSVIDEISQEKSFMNVKSQDSDYCSQSQT